MNEFNDGDWGIRLNEKHYSKFNIEAPDWAKVDLGLTWYAEGIVIWDEARETVINMNFWNAMTLLEHLHNDQQWKEQGQDVSEEKIQFSIPIRKRRRSKSAPSEEAPPIENGKIITTLHLSPDQTQKLLDFLEQNKRQIYSRGSLIKSGYDHAMRTIADMIIEDMIQERNQNNTQE